MAIKPAKKTSTNTGKAKAGTNTTATGFTYEPFDPNKNENIQQANSLLVQNNANKPGAWVDPYQSQHTGYLSQYENRDPFSYDFNSDALYQQYRDQYIQQGQMAMMDTMGQAAAMTGGYGNSYAQSVGQQTYNQYLNQLNEIIPELNQMAYDRYQQEGQDLLNMYNIYKGLSDDSYGKWNDSVDRWYQENARLTDNYNTIYGREWDMYNTNLGLQHDDYNTQLNIDNQKKAGGNTGNTGTTYTALDGKTQDEWNTKIKKQETWSGLTNVFKNMIIAKHDPLESANFILDNLANKNIKPTREDLESWGELLEKNGYTEDEVAQFVIGWMENLEIAEEKPYNNGVPDPWRAVQAGQRGGGGGAKSTEIGRFTY